MSFVEDSDVVLGFKRITAENITSLDITRLFGKYSDAEWIDLFNGPLLLDVVPEPVQRMFELARGTMIYGRYYYPLLTLGYAECTRTLEAGARHAAHLGGLAPEPHAQVKLTYEKIIGKLHEAELISATTLERWSTGRLLRNSFSHQTTPTILPPSDASAKLRGTGQQLNQLFMHMRKH
jgi:hypothetical protein